VGAHPYDSQECPVDVRIGVTHTPKELDIELPSDADREEIRVAVEKAMTGDAAVLWLTDRHGREICVPGEKIAYVELGSPETERRIGFGAG
jgi:hypothetical protein